MPGDFTILMVCSGNICRSPLAEQLVRVGLGQVPGVVLASAGTIARDGDLMTPQAQALSVRFGGDPSAHRAQRVDAGLIGNADLILAMAREHRREVVSAVPRSVRRAFTIREFARLAQAISLPELQAIGSGTESTAERLRRAVELVASFRGQVDPPDDPADDDVVDPYRESDAVYELSAAQLVPAAHAVVRVLTTAAGPVR